MELVQLPPRSTSDSISSSACSLRLHLTNEYRAEISPTLCVPAGQERQTWGARGPVAETTGREHWWEMPNMLQSPPSVFSPSSGSHPHPEPSPLQSSWFQGHSTALQGCFVPPGARAKPGFLSRSAAHQCPPRCVRPSPAPWPGLASLQLRGHGEGRQALAAAQGGSHSQEGARGNREHVLPSRSLQTQLDAHPTAEGSASGEEAGAAPNGKGGRPRSRDTVQQWHRGGQSG